MSRARPVALLILVGVGLAVWAVFGLTSTSWFLVVLGGCAVLMPFIIGIVRGRLDIFEPVYLFALSYAVLFVLRPAFDLLAQGGPTPLLGYSVSPTYSNALGIAAVGAAAFYGGYYFPPGRLIAQRLPLIGEQWSRASLNVCILLVLILSAGVYVVFLTTNGGLTTLFAFLSGRNPLSSSILASSSGYLYTAPLWVTSLGILLLALSPRWRSAQSMMGFGLLIYSQLTTVAAGDRSWTLPVLAAVFLLWYLRRGRRPSLLILGGVLMVVFIFGITVPRQYRFTPDRRTDLWQVVQTAALNPFDALGQFFGGGDSAMVDDLAVEIQTVPSVLPYQYGSTYLESLARPIPRAVWPEKPRAADNLLMATIWPDFAKQNVGFSFSVFGEPYLNFGLAGVVVISVIFGVAWRVLYAWLLRSPRSPTMMAIYALSWPFLFVYMRGGIGVDYQRQLIFLLPVLGAAWLAQVHTSTSGIVIRRSSLHFPTVAGRVSEQAAVTGEQ